MISEQTGTKEQQKDKVREEPIDGRSLAEILSGLKHHRTVDRKILLLLLLLGIAYTLYLARDFLLPISVAFLLSFVLQPLVRGFEWIKFPAGLAAGIVIVLAVIVIGSGVYYLSNPAADWINRGPMIRKQLEFKFRKVKHSLREAQETTKKLEEITALKSEEAPEVVVKGPGLVSKIFAQTQTTIIALLIVVILTYFLLWRGQDTLIRMAKSISGSRQSQIWTEIMVRIEKQIGLYLQTITVINCVLGIVTAGTMKLLGMPTPVLWGVVAGVLNFLPYLGPLVTVCILTIVSALTFDDWYRIALPPLIFMVFTALEGQIITPTILGSRLRIDPVLVFTSILFWGWIWGAAGALLAVPVLAVLKIVFSNVESLKPYEELFG